MAYSLRSALTSLWVLILILSLSIGAILVAVVRQGVSAHIDEAAARARAGCAAIKDRYERYFASGTRPTAPLSQEIVARELTFLLEVVLAEFDGMEGGIWDPANQFIAYAFPSYQGAAPKRDVPEAERPRIVELVSTVSRQGGMNAQRYETKREALLLHACSLAGSSHDVAWTMTRVSADSSASNANLRLGLAILFLFAVLSGAWLWRLRRRWSNQVDQLEQAIAAYPLEQLPHIPETGERELDRIVAAVNHLSTRLATARDETGRLSKRLAHADRLASLGRMAAALAHEIRNPIAAMRLKAENALAQSPDRQQMALTAVLQQVHRLDGLLQRLMALIQPVDLDPQPVSLRAWLQDRIAHHQEHAEQSGVRLRSDAPETTAIFDGNSMARAIDNLMLNALQHTPAGGTIEVTIRTGNNTIIFSVEDSGHGVPHSERERMFEPFMTTRVDGTGLGLAIVREIAEAHNGTVRYEPGRQGARFTVELPWQQS